MLPAGIANMAPVFFKWVPLLKYPIDFNRKYKGMPIFGKNKTFRGFLFGILMAILVVFLQKTFYAETEFIAIIDYSQVCPLLLGFLFGFGALFGDLIESFFKRQARIEAGKSWFPFDQTDWILGGLLFMSLYIQVPWHFYLISIVLFGILHPIINLIGFYLKIKKNKF